MYLKLVESVDNFLQSVDQAAQCSQLQLQRLGWASTRLHRLQEAGHALHASVTSVVYRLVRHTPSVYPTLIKGYDLLPSQSA